VHRSILGQTLDNIQCKLFCAHIINVLPPDSMVKILLVSSGADHTESLYGSVRNVSEAPSGVSMSTLFWRILTTL
jgi:hypothetical protein